MFDVVCCAAQKSALEFKLNTVQTVPKHASSGKSPQPLGDLTSWQAAAAACTTAVRQGELQRPKDQRRQKQDQILLLFGFHNPPPFRDSSEGYDLGNQRLSKESQILSNPFQRRQKDQC